MFDFLQMRKSIETLKSTLLALNAEQQGLLSERSRVEHAPPSKEDMLALADGWMASQAAGLEAYIAATFTEPLRRARVGSTALPADAGSTLPIKLFHDNASEPERARVLAMLLCGLMAKPLQAAIGKGIADGDASAAGLPAAKRSQRLQQIDSRLAEIERLKTTYEQQIADAGFQLT